MLRIHFSMSNAAFEETGASECARILRDLAERIEESGGFEYLRICDANGNSIGELQMSEPDTEEEE